MVVIDSELQLHCCSVGMKINNNSKYKSYVAYYNIVKPIYMYIILTFGAGVFV